MRVGTLASLSLCVALLAALVPGALNAADESDFAALRQELVSKIEADVRQTSLWIGKRALDERVMEALGAVPRHEFVPDAQIRHAYENRPLPIGYGQTISQPYIVALMTDLIGVDEDDRVLEIGTGSGYQAAVLAELVAEVYTIEIIPELAAQAAERLRRLGYANVETRTGDGYYGWAERAAFDAIIVTAAAGHVPPPLIDQLKPGGRMIIPIGSPFLTQELVLIEKSPEGVIRTRNVLPVVFVPLTRQ